MSSGFGILATKSKCYNHFADYTECLRNGSDPLTTCPPLRNDYLECIHSKNQNKRVNELKEKEEQVKTGKVPSHGGGGHH
mmetsp:Transcript_30620/g.33460  ORF Transcript_30620/g.33460 Transcript_30620/m.33460 type:complete len:80 (+) Transcript_30620:50-289(+)|eukprot:gene188-194_t